MKETRCLHCYSNEFTERNGHLYCNYCGSKYTQRPEDQETLLSGAYQALRFMNFVDAENQFEDIIQRYPKLPEAHWGLVCAKYGIKFEQDFSGKQIPTCCMPTIESFLDDPHYQKAVLLSDMENMVWYKQQAEYIERVRDTWITHAADQPPYDIFISYKESDSENGIDRTDDSVEAQALYTHLIKAGYRAFYSRECLSDVAGEKYEPYIFHALNTAKVMIVYGTKAEYISSTWLKNEWQRFGKKIEQGEKAAGSLIVICDGFSPKELPVALRSMQVLDGKSKSCYQELDERLQRLLKEEGKKPPKTQAVQVSAPKAEGTPKRGLWGVLKEKKRERIAKADSKELDYMYHSDGTCEAYVRDTWRHYIRHISIPYVLPDKVRVTGVAENAFDVQEYRESKLESVKLSEGLLRIKKMAFCNCVNLTNIVLPSSLKEIREKVFEGCKKLENIVLPENLTHLGDSAFSGCLALKSVTIPRSVERMGEKVFYGCPSLTDITYTGTQKEWQALLNERTLFLTFPCTVHCTDGDITQK